MHEKTFDHTKPKEVQEFLKRLQAWFSKNKRNFYFRKEDYNLSPYECLIIEVMSQQTQIERVEIFAKKWMTRFPNIKTLSNADTKDVLELWKGLGYNSRSLRLLKLAKEVCETYGGELPKNFENLVKLPGIGEYTANAILTFSHNKTVLLCDTNIEKVCIYHFLSNKQNIAKLEIQEIIKVLVSENKKEPREFFASLMDYSAFLRKEVKKNPNRQQKTYTKQSIFVGSVRQYRAKALFLLTKKSYNFETLEQELKKELLEKYNRERLEKALLSLEKEKVIRKENQKYSLLS